jgi:hypothetical protein
MDAADQLLAVIEGTHPDIVTLGLSPAELQRALSEVLVPALIPVFDEMRLALLELRRRVEAAEVRLRGVMN